MSIDISKEFYSLSKIKYLLKKELKNINSNLIDLELKKTFLINKPTIIYDINDLSSSNSSQLLEIIPNNGIKKTIGLLKANNINIDRKIDPISKNLNKSLDFIAIDIQRRYSMLNEDYFKTHFDPIYLETYKDNNSRIDKLKERFDVSNVSVTYDKIKYDQVSILPSRKQNLIDNVKDVVPKIISSIAPLSTLDQTFILNKYIKSIDKRLEEITTHILYDYKFVNNDYISKSFISKEEDYKVDLSTSSDSLIKKTLNGHAIISKALEKGLPVLDSMYEEKIDFKIMEIGTFEDVVFKINTVIEQLNNDSKELEIYMDSLLENELNNEKTYMNDPFYGLL